VTTLRNVASAPASWPFTPIEELDLYLENAHEPSLIQLETHAQGHLDRTVLQAALAKVLAADPAARRRLAAARWARRLRWEAPAAGSPDGRHHVSGGSLTVAAWDSPGQLTALRERLSAWPLILTDTAVRVTLAVGTQHDAVIVQTHHAAFDGVSSLALLTALCAAYRERVGIGAGARAGAGRGVGPETAAPTLPGPGPAWPTAQHRSGTGPGPAAPAGRSRPGPAWLPGVVTRVAARAGQPGRPGYGAVLRSVDVPRPARQGSGPFPTVNDLLVAALILAVDRWNAAHGGRSGTIRIAVPVNDRDPERRWEGPGNLSRLVRVTARSGQRADPASLLAQVAAQTRAGKLQPRPGLDAVSRLLAAGWAPAVVKRPTARLARRLAWPVCTDTALVSNLGVLPDPPSFSGAGREPLWFSGPAPMPRGLGAGAVTVAGRLHLCVHYQHALLGSGAAADFTAVYCRALAELAGLSQGRPL
jgi:NRPS condensation-like uncharacterized protein